jgi:hypothetical protein
MPQVIHCLGGEKMLKNIKVRTRLILASSLMLPLLLVKANQDGSGSGQVETSAGALSELAAKLEVSLKRFKV